MDWMEKRYKMAVHVKVCFVMDCTASMEPYIHHAKTKMTSLIENVIREHPNAQIQVSFIGYRDYGDEERMIVIPFQTAVDTMYQIRNVEAIGGDDIAEDVAHGLEAALHQDWSEADVKIVFLLADAPAHGAVFHSASVSDRYPRGDPEGFDPRDFVEKMSFLDMNFTFVRIHERTDTMIEVFENCYAQGGTFTVMDLRPQSLDNHADVLSAELTRSITHTITQHYTASQAL